VRWWRSRKSTADAVKNVIGVSVLAPATPSCTRIGTDSATAAPSIAHARAAPSSRAAAYTASAVSPRKGTGTSRARKIARNGSTTASSSS
jgi:hypothetical protein